VRLGRRIGFFMASAALLGATAARAERALPPTHTAVLDSLAVRVTAELLAGQSLPAGRTLSVPPTIPGDSLGLFGSRLLEALRARSGSIRILPAPGARPAAGADPETLAAADSRDLRIVASVQSEGVSYVRADRGFLGRPKAYERFGLLQATLTLVDGPEQTVLWTRSASAEHRDRVARGDLDYVAVGSGRLSPVPPGGKGLRLLEPLIVIGVVAGLVVLFYSNRN
jgi:hypothetical protein